MSKVFILNRGFHDYSKAQKFGELIFMSEGQLNKYCPGSMLREFNKYISSSDSGDHILISSMSIANSLASSLFVLKHNRLNFLIYNSVADLYVSRKIDFSQFSERK